MDGPLTSPPLVLRVPPNSPSVTVAPFVSRVLAESAPATHHWQLDGADNLAMQPDQGDESGVGQSGPAVAVVSAVDLDNTPPLPDSDFDVEEPQLVSCRYFL